MILSYIKCYIFHGADFTMRFMFRRAIYRRQKEKRQNPSGLSHSSPSSKYFHIELSNSSPHTLRETKRYHLCVACV
jgi:hypothetical protein